MILLAVKPWSWWFTIRELQRLQLPGLPLLTRGLNGVAGSQGWRWRRYDDKPLARNRDGTKVTEYYSSLFPEEAQEQLVVLEHMLRRDGNTVLQASRALLSKLSAEERQLLLLRLIAAEFGR